MAARRINQLGTGKLAGLLFTLLLATTACDTAPLGIGSGNLVTSTVGVEAVPTAQPMLAIQAQSDDARLVVNYVRTFAASSVEIELQTAEGDLVATIDVQDEGARFADLEPGTYRVLTLEREQIVESTTEAVLAGQRAALSETFIVTEAGVTSLVCDDSGCTIS